MINLKREKNAEEELGVRLNLSSFRSISCRLTWPNPGDQQGGVAMHSRAQISVETHNAKSTYTVTAGEKNSAVSVSSLAIKHLLMLKI